LQLQRLVRLSREEARWKIFVRNMRRLTALCTLAACLLYAAVGSVGADKQRPITAKPPSEGESAKDAAGIDADLRKLMAGEEEDEEDGKGKQAKNEQPPAPQLPTEPPLVDLLDHGEEEDEAAKEKSNATEAEEAAFLPEEGAAEKEHSNSLAIFFVLSILIMCVLTVHFILRARCHLLPESLVIIFLGAVVGLFMRALPADQAKSVESFSPTIFFLVMLPPIIFESGYNLHKGNFFANIGSILLFAIVGTLISALVVGGGVYLLGLADIVYRLNFVQSFAFGSLISAVDPVATLAIFQALDVDPVLNMLVFGESILNDAVAIVLTTTVLESDQPEFSQLTTGEQVAHGISRFMAIFLGSAVIGTVIGLLSSLVLKHVDLYHNPSLEFALMLCLVYSPYALAEGIHLSGIMSILFCGIVMSQYTHYNLSPGNATDIVVVDQRLFCSDANHDAANHANVGLYLRVLRVRLLGPGHLQLSTQTGSGPCGVVGHLHPDRTSPQHFPTLHHLQSLQTITYNQEDDVDHVVLRLARGHCLRPQPPLGVRRRDEKGKHQNREQTCRPLL